MKFILNENVTIFNDDCLKIFSEIEDSSVDLILTDPPYATTSCSWDSIIPFDEMWKHLERIITPRGAIVLFSQQPFTTKLISSNLVVYKYNWIWKKSKVFNVFNSKNSPIKSTEDICVFSKGTIANKSENLMNYYPQGLKYLGKEVSGGKNRKDTGHKIWRPSHKESYFQEYTNYPNNLLEFASVHKNFHPTEKPVPLLEYLVKTYTLENNLVLDFTSGSFSTGEACINTNRKFIGIELEKSYFDFGKNRLEEAIQRKNSSKKVVFEDFLI